MAVRVELAEGESFSAAMRRFRKYVIAANIKYEIYWHSQFTKKCEERRRRTGNAKRRAQGARSMYEILQREEAESRFA